MCAEECSPASGAPPGARATVSAVPARIVLEPDPVIEAYKRDVDRTLLRENLKLTVDQRLRKLEDVLRFFEDWRGAARQTPP